MPERALGRLVAEQRGISFLNNLKGSSSICFEAPHTRFRLAHLLATVAFGWRNELFMSLCRILIFLLKAINTNSTVN